MSALYQFSKVPEEFRPEIVCYEKQADWCGQWNITWQTGTDEHGEPLHNSQYYHLWTNGPKECLEYPYYTFDQHFGKQIPSFPPGPVIRDYLEGRMRTSNEDLKRYIQFSTIVRRVEYHKETDDFTVLVKPFTKDQMESVERFTHVIVAVGIFHSPYSFQIPGLMKFPGRILHSHNFREAREFQGQRILVIGLSYSGEDIALQTLKYGTKSVVICGRATRGLIWPSGVEERVMVVRFDGNIANFQDGSTGEFDVVIFCTGYKARFPFLSDDLSLPIPEPTYYPNLYKGILWAHGGNNKLLYLGMQNQLWSMNMFDAQALWAVRYIMGESQIPKSKEELVQDIERWQEKLARLTTRHATVDFIRDYVSDVAKDAKYTSVENIHKIAEHFHRWENDRCENIATFRDHQYRSVFTGTLSPIHHTPFMDAYDDTMETFVNQTPNKPISKPCN